ncbi:MAG: carboxypeptidase regulatory-like domain-containing protein [Acidobacteriaceae bacterium]|nr:carboxypeptidase regulatory-like domain-containing protein [Acidobacteriaceae bacterium]
MRRTRLRCFQSVAVGVAVFWAGSAARMSAQELAGETVRIDNDDLGGVVSSTKGPEAGVWVIAETGDLPTRFAKIVVTDDHGRYVVPDLPKANYTIWVRGYGLVDSQKVQSQPGRIVNLTAIVAPDPRAAAQYYPASYWYSLLRVPAKNEFPGTGPKGNGISEKIQSQAQWLEIVKTDGCWSCHQLGNKATREIPKSLDNFDSPVLAWERRIQSGQAGGNMTAVIGRLGRERALAMFADWSSSIAGGELPPAPRRPGGVERNIVITEWDWSGPKAYLHDEIATDKRNPAVNANGLLYGAPELSTDDMPILDPVRDAASQAKVPVRDPKTPGPGPVIQPSPYWGTEAIWTSQANVHNPMFDEKGRVWLTSAIRPPENPAYCKEGSSQPSAKLFPLNRSGRQLARYDPETRQFTLINTCFSTHHLQFAEDANRTLWTSSGGGGDVVGWLNTKMFDETHDEVKSQGWTALILDTNGNGKRDAYVEPGEPVDPTKDKRISGSFYGVTVSPADGSIWGSVLGFPGSIVRLNPGPNPPETALAEIYELPWNNPKAPIQGFSPRGLDIDRNGVVWTVLASGHFASFDRRKCKGPLNGPIATGQHCPEGWTLYPMPAPQFADVTDSGSAEASYYDWVDQFDTFGLGANVPIATGNGEDALLALSNGKWVVLRVPYPIGFYAKGLDGRIDDPQAGWKGKGLWSTYATRAPFHVEGGKGTTSKVVHFQLRPDPLSN